MSYVGKKRKVHLSLFFPLLLPLPANMTKSSSPLEVPVPGREHAFWVELLRFFYVTFFLVENAISVKTETFHRKWSVLMNPLLGSFSALGWNLCVCVWGEIIYKVISDESINWWSGLSPGMWETQVHIPALPDLETWDLKPGFLHPR